ncbi:hypothetical protein BT63DRAFT_82685 [Microthyrium microscopicum]|uniref:Uncharacterized protein n=1 Tax=Microthyrium microscopicum TaxID=703497 RepID=A0A6A6TY63_9PEZI|nr:hypothetical protein BT63DRAFT_82685 [Microthyrium microscopicum]
MEAIAAKRRALPTGAIMRDYEFCVATNRYSTGQLTQLVTADRSLVVYNLKFGVEVDEPCSMCAAIVDALNAYAKHIEQYVNLVVVAKRPTAKLNRYACRRGWKNLCMLSSFINDFKWI